MKKQKINAFPYETFETISSFKRSVSHGAEIELVWKDIIYSITHDDNKISISQAYKQKTEKLYDTADDVLDAVFDGQRLREIIKDIYVTMRTI